MPITRRNTEVGLAATEAEPCIEGEASPLAIPLRPGQRPGQPNAASRSMAETGDLRGFAMALGLIIVLVLGLSAAAGLLRYP